MAIGLDTRFCEEVLESENCFECASSSSKHCWTMMSWTCFKILSLKLLCHIITIKMIIVAGDLSIICFKMPSDEKTLHHLNCCRWIFHWTAASSVGWCSNRLGAIAIFAVQSYFWLKNFGTKVTKDSAQTNKKYCKICSLSLKFRFFF